MTYEELKAMDAATVIKDMTAGGLIAWGESIATAAAQKAIEDANVDSRRDGAPAFAKSGNGLYIGADGRVQVGETRSQYKAYTDDTTGIGAAIVLRAFAAAGGDFEKAKTIVDGWNKSCPTPEGEQVVKALTQGSAASAGNFIQTQYSNDLIGLLRNATVIRRAGARTIPLDKGNLTINKVTGGSTAYYRSEGAYVAPSGMTTSQMTLNSKELIGLVAISNKLLKHASLAVDVLVREDLVATFGLKEDSTFLRSDGTSNTPTGLRHLAHADNIFAATGAAAPTLAQVRSTVSKAKLKLKNANVPMRKPVWIMSPRTEEFLMNLADGNGNLVYGTEMGTRNTFANVPYFSSNVVPENLSDGTNADCSEMYLADMSEVFIGEDGSLDVEIARDVTYALGDGTLRSAFSAGETVIQATTNHDFGVRYDKAIAVIKDLRWTP